MEAFNARRPADAFQPDWDDLRVLYDLTRERRPGLVVEFGSGCSTVVFAKAVADNGVGRVISFDHTGWGDITEQNMPGELRPYVELRRVTKLEVSRPGVTDFAEPPDLVPDLVYLDGPGREDLLRLEPAFPDGFLLVIDGRHGTAEYLKQRFARAYRIQDGTQHIFALR